MVVKTISDYGILEHLGSGGRGAVSKAEDISLRRIVALKFLHANDDPVLQQFLHGRSEGPY